MEKSELVWFDGELVPWDAAQVHILTHTLHYGRIVRGRQVVDEVLVAVMRAPRTYTREDVVEISCHGGLLPAKAVLDTVLAGGARLAGRDHPRSRGRAVPGGRDHAPDEPRIGHRRQ